MTSMLRLVIVAKIVGVNVRRAVLHRMAYKRRMFRPFNATASVSVNLYLVKDVTC